MKDFCRIRAIQRSFGRGGCSQALLFLLLLVILLLSSPSSSSSSSTSSLLSPSFGTPYIKGVSLSGMELMTFRLTARDSTSRPLGLLPLSSEEASMVLFLLLVPCVVDDLTLTGFVMSLVVTLTRVVAPSFLCIRELILVAMRCHDAILITGPFYCTPSLVLYGPHILHSDIVLSITWSADHGLGFMMEAIGFRMQRIIRV